MLNRCVPRSGTCGSKPPPAPLNLEGVQLMSAGHNLFDPSEVEVHLQSLYRRYRFAGHSG